MRLLACSLLLCARLAAADELPGPDDPRASPPTATEPTVPVTFRGPTNYRVLVGRKFCAAPCVLDLAPGVAHLVVVGESPRGLRPPQFEQELVVPDRAATVIVDPNYRMKKIVGGALLGAGIVVALVGGIVLGVGEHLNDDRNAMPATPMMQYQSADVVEALGAVYLAVGVLVGISGGVLLGLPDGKRVDVQPAAPPAPLGLRWMGVGASAMASGGGVRLRFEF